VNEPWKWGMDPPPPIPVVLISSHITERQAATAEILMLGPATGWDVRRGGGVKLDPYPRGGPGCCTIHDDDRKSPKGGG